MQKNKKVENKLKMDKKPSFAKLDRLYKDKDWKKFKNKPIIPVGADTMTNTLVGNIGNGCNFIIGGKKGSGKSTFLHSAMVNLLKNTNPTKFKFILVDLDKSDLMLYKNISNLLFPVITDLDKVKAVLHWCTLELSRRFQLILDRNVKKGGAYLKLLQKEMPTILVVISECSDLVKKKHGYSRKALYDLADLGRLGNINLLICTAEISENLYSRKFLGSFHKVALATRSAKESKLLIGKEGAERLRGRGDGIYKRPDKKGKSCPIQCLFISKKETKTFLASLENKAV